MTPVRRTATDYLGTATQGGTGTRLFILTLLFEEEGTKTLLKAVLRHAWIVR